MEANVSFVVCHKRSGFICAEEEIEVALPRELSQDEHLEIIRTFVQKNFVSKAIQVFKIHPWKSQ